MSKSRSTFVLILSLLMALVVFGCGDDGDNEEITVMTYNVYLGGDAESIFVASPDDQAALLATVAQVYQQIVNSDYQSRAEAIAASINEHRPHLVGLQEPTVLTSLDSEDMPSIHMDFLEMLESELTESGPGYEVAASVHNTTVTLPLLLPGETTPLNVRAVFSDVILARSDVEVSNIETANYEAGIPSPLGFKATRGYVALDATVSGTTYRVVSTHLESYALPPRQAQAGELIAILADETMPLILLGDFNSDADLPGEVYSLLTAAGYEDVWQGGPDTGFTCCQNFDLGNEASLLDERIDHIFVRNVDLASAMTETVGDQPEDRITASSGMEIWPSDHAGVVAELSIR